jgi:biotin carboxyl carrier protein
VIKINAKKGEEIKKGNVVLVIEAMKMENNIIAHRDTRIEKITVSVGQMIEAGVPVVYFEKENT